MNLIKAARSFSGLTQQQFGEELARMGLAIAGEPLKPVSRHRVCHWERAKREVPAWAEQVAVERLVNQWWALCRREGGRRRYGQKAAREPGDADFARALQLPELVALYEARALLEELDLSDTAYGQLVAALETAIEAVEDKFEARWGRILPLVSFR